MGSLVAVIVVTAGIVIVAQFNLSSILFYGRGCVLIIIIKPRAG